MRVRIKRGSVVDGLGLQLATVPGSPLAARGIIYGSK
jgi:hypothetical protein